MAEGQWAAARGLYQPMILSFGAAIAFFNNKILEKDSNSLSDAFIGETEPKDAETKDEEM